MITAHGSMKMNLWVCAALSGLVGHAGAGLGCGDSGTPGVGGSTTTATATGSGGSTTGSLRVVAEPINWPEGPLYIDGQLGFVAYGSHQVFRWDGAKTTELWHQDGCGPSAIERLDNGDLYVTCYDSNTLAHLSADGKTIENIAKDSQGGAFVGPNDFARDNKGGLYFSASGKFDPAAPVEGKVYYRSSTGDIKMVADKIHYSNGLAVTVDGKNLLVAEHLAAQVLIYTIAADGSLSDRKVWKKMSDLAPPPADATGYYGCDGVKRDAAGNVYIANYGGSRLFITDPSGKLLHTVEVPYEFIDNVGLGPDLFGQNTPSPQHLEDFLYLAVVKDDAAQPYPGAIFQAPNPAK